MAAGVSGHYDIDCGSGFKLRVNYSESYDVANNSSNFEISSVQCTANVSWYDFYPDGKIYINGSCVKTMDSRTPTGSVTVESGKWKTISNTSCNKASIGHNQDGSKSIKVKLTGNRYSKFSMFGNGSYSGWGCDNEKTIALTTIPRASVPSCVTWPENQKNVGNIGSSIYIHTNRKSDKFKHTVKYTFGNATGTIATNVTDNTQWTIPMSLCNQIPNATSGTGTITCETYNGSTKVGTKTCEFTCTVPSSVKPSISNLAATLDNSANAVIKGWGVAVASYTKVKLTANAEGSYSSTIKSFEISNAYTATPTGASLNYTGGVINSGGEKTFSVRSVDSRGRKSDAATVKVTYQAYSNPTISGFSAERIDATRPDGTVAAEHLRISKSHSFSPVGGHNSITATLKYKKHTVSSWSTYGSIGTGGSVNAASVNFSEDSTYDLSLTIADAVGRTATATFLLPTVEVLMDFRAGGRGLGIGKKAETDALEVSLDAIFSGNVYIQDSNGNKMSLANYIRQVMS